MRHAYTAHHNGPYALKSFKFFASGSEETNCFTATLTRDGKKVADASNDGQGGENRLYFTNPEERNAFEAYASSLEPDTYEEAGELEAIQMSPDYLISLMTDEEIAKIEAKKIAKHCKDKTVFRYKGDGEGEWRTTYMVNKATKAKRPFTSEEFAAKIATKGEVECHLNEAILADPLAAMRF